MGLLGVLDLASVLPWRRVQIFLAVELASLVAGGRNSRLRQRRGVGSHISDVAVLIETLRDAHGALRGEPQLAAGLLLQRRGHERRVGTARVGLLLDGGHVQLSATQTGSQLARRRLVEDQHLGGLLDRTQRVEITAGGHPPTIDGVEFGSEPGR